MKIEGIEEAIEAEVQRRVAEKLTELAQSFSGKAAAHRAWATRKGASPKGAAGVPPAKCSTCGRNLRCDNRSGLCT